MMKFFHWWLAMVAFMAFQFGIAGLAFLTFTVVARYSNVWAGASVVLLVASALGAAVLSRPVSPWFRKLSMQLSDR